MNKELLDAYNKLPLNIKRDKLCNEIIAIDNVLNFILSSYDVNYSDNVKNYNINEDSLKDEDEFLNFIYDDVYLLEQKILTVVQLMAMKNDNH